VREGKKKRTATGASYPNPDANIFSMIDQPVFISIRDPRFPTARVLYG